MGKFLLQSRDRSNGSQGGPRQRAEALAALSSAFNSSPSSKSPPRRSGLTSQASQRAAAVAALSQVLTAEKKKSPDTSPSGMLLTSVDLLHMSERVNIRKYKTVEKHDLQWNKSKTVEFAIFRYGLYDSSLVLILAYLELIYYLFNIVSLFFVLLSLVWICW